MDVVAPAVIFQSVPDEANPAQISAGVNVNGGNGGFDQFVFHHADATLVEATADVINNFTTFSDTIRLFLQNDVTNLQAFPGITYC